MRAIGGDIYKTVNLNHNRVSKQLEGLSIHLGFHCFPLFSAKGQSSVTSQMQPCFSEAWSSTGHMSTHMLTHMPLSPAAPLSRREPVSYTSEFLPVLAVVRGTESLIMDECGVPLTQQHRLL